MKLTARIWNALVSKCTPISNLDLFWLQDIKWSWAFKKTIINSNKRGKYDKFEENNKK